MASDLNHDQSSTTVKPQARCYLFYGPDESGSRALIDQLVRRLGDDVERVELTPSQIRTDPALLADEASSASLFGHARYVRVNNVGDDCLNAIEALLATPAVACPVILLAGTLKKDSRLIRRTKSDPQVELVASQSPDAIALVRALRTQAVRHGLTLSNDAAQRLIDECGSDRDVLTRELEKFSSYLDASPGESHAVDAAVIDAIGAARQEGEASELVNAMCSGKGSRLEQAFAGIADVDAEAIGLVRAALRRVITMAAVRAEVDRGYKPHAAVERAGRTLFWGDRDAVARDITSWSAIRLNHAGRRLLALESTLKSGRGAGSHALRQLFYSLTRETSRH